MTKVNVTAAALAGVLTVALASAQTSRNSGKTPDRPLPNSDAAKQAQTATINGCVVRDAANDGQPTISSNGISYKLTGKRDSEMAQFLGKRVEVTGTLDSGSAGARATTGKTSDVPKDQTATAGQSDVPVTDAPRDNTTPGVQDASKPESVPLKTDKGTTADLTRRIDVKTIKIVSTNCL